jgi:hypothetical protein
VDPIVDVIYLDVAKVSLTATDMNGNRLDRVEVGDTFLLTVHVEDVRNDQNWELGVFAMYMDLLYDPALLEIVGGIQHSNTYSQMPMGDVSLPGLINDSGGFSGSLKPVGGGVLQLYSIPMRAIAPGTAAIAADPADCGLVTGIGVYGRDDVIPEESVEFGALTLQIGSSGKAPMSHSDLLNLGAEGCSPIIKSGPPIEYTIEDDVEWVMANYDSQAAVKGFLDAHADELSAFRIANPLFQVLWLSLSDDTVVSSTVSELDLIPLISSSTEVTALPVDSVTSDYPAPNNDDSESVDLEALDSVFAELDVIELTTI